MATAFMEIDEDEQFAALLDQVEESAAEDAILQPNHASAYEEREEVTYQVDENDDGEDPALAEEFIPDGQPDDDADTDWDAVMRAAEEVAAHQEEDEQHQQQRQPPPAHTNRTPNFSLVATQLLASTAPDTFFTNLTSRGRPASQIDPTQLLPTQVLPLTGSSTASHKTKTFADCFSTPNSFHLPTQSSAACSSAPPGEIDLSTLSHKTTTYQSTTANPALKNQQLPVSTNVAHKPTSPNNYQARSASANPSTTTIPKKPMTVTNGTNRGVAFGGAPVAPSAPSALPSRTYIKESTDELRDKISGFKITNRIISTKSLQEKLEGSKVMSIVQTMKRSQTHPTVRAPAAISNSFGGGTSAASGAGGAAFGILGNWVLFGVLTHKSPPKTTSTGKGQFVVWTISDLEGHHATILLFGKAFEAYWKIEEGSVLAFANPEDSSGFVGGKSKTGPSNSATPSLCLSLKFTGQVLEVGRATDFAYCKSYRNEPGTHGHVKGLVKCKNVVNLSKGEYCEYHIKTEYKKIMRGRAELNQSRDKPAFGFAAPNVLPAKSHQASTQKLLGGIDRKAIMNGVARGQAIAAANKKVAASSTINQIMGRGATATTSTARAPWVNPFDPKAALKQKEQVVSEQVKAEQVKRWDALNSKTTGSSRFVHRIVASSLGQTGAIVDRKTADAGLLKTVQTIKQEKLASLQIAQAKLKPPQPNPLALTSTTPSRPSSATVTPSPATTTTKPPIATSTASTASAHSPTTVTTPRPTTATVSNTPTILAVAPPSSLRPFMSNSAAAPSAVKPTTTPSPAPTSRASVTHPNSTKSTPSHIAAAMKAAQPSSAAFLKAFGSSSNNSLSSSQSSQLPSSSDPLGSGLIPMLGRGWSHSSQSTPSLGGMNAGERKKAAQQAAQIEKVKQLREMGLLKKPDPNSTTSVRLPLQPAAHIKSGVNGATLAGVKRKSMEDAELKPQTTYALLPGGAVALKSSLPNGSTSSSAMMDESVDDDLSSEEQAARVKRAKLATAFGQVHDSATLERLLGQTSAHSDLVHESEASRAAQDALFDLMEKKEAVAIQADSISEQRVKVYKCLHPGCNVPLSEYPLGSCNARHHRVERIEVTKRFFKCHQCSFFLPTLQDKLPTHACHKCGSKVWTRTSMIPMVSRTDASMCANHLLDCGGHSVVVVVVVNYSCQ